MSGGWLGPNKVKGRVACKGGGRQAVAGLRSVGVREGRFGKISPNGVRSQGRRHKPPTPCFVLPRWGQGRQQGQMSGFTPQPPNCLGRGKAWGSVPTRGYWQWVGSNQAQPWGSGKGELEGSRSKPTGEEGVWGGVWAAGEPSSHPNLWEGWGHVCGIRHGVNELKLGLKSGNKKVCLDSRGHNSGGSGLLGQGGIQPMPTSVGKELGEGTQ